MYDRHAARIKCPACLADFNVLPQSALVPVSAVVQQMQLLAQYQLQQQQQQQMLQLLQTKQAQSTPARSLTSAAIRPLEPIQTANPLPDLNKQLEVGATGKKRTKRQSTSKPKGKKAKAEAAATVPAGDAQQQQEAQAQAPAAAEGLPPAPKRPNSARRQWIVDHRKDYKSSHSDLTTEQVTAALGEQFDHLPQVERDQLEEAGQSRAHTMRSAPTW